MRMTWVLLVTIACAAWCPMSAEDWPRFRGPQGSGLSASSKAPAEFGPEKNLAWKVSVAPGHSSPVVCGNQLYITSFDEGVLRTHAFDTRTGKALWSGELPRSRKAKQNMLNNAASPTPLCDSNGVIVYFGDFGLAAWTVDGKANWRVPLPALVNNHGMSSSPVLGGNMVVQVHASDMGSQVIGVRRESGKEVWREKLFGVTYSTPAVTPDGQVIVVSTGEAVAFDLETGKRRWWVARVPYQPKSSPILSGDGKQAYFAVLSVDEGSKAALSSYEKLLEQFDVNGDGQITIGEMRERKGPAGAFAQIDMNGDGVFTKQEQEEVMRISEAPHLAAAVATAGSGDQTGKLRWSLRKGVPNVASPILVGEVLYLFKEGGVLTAVRAADGAVLKEGRISAGFGAVYSSPIAAGNRLYIANQQGKVTVLKAAPEWEVLAVNDLGEECFATPAVADDRIFVRTATTLWCFRQTD